MDCTTIKIHDRYHVNEGLAFYEKKKQTWIDKKTNILQTLGEIMPAMEVVLDAGCYVFPQMKTVKLVSTVAKVCFFH